MSPPERLLIAVAVLAVGALLGLLLRRPLGRGPQIAPSASPSPGLILVTAPFCTRCRDLHTRLDRLRISARDLDAATNPELVTILGVRSAPTLLAIADNGSVIDREHHDFSDERLRALATVTSARPDRCRLDLPVWRNP